jgi:hypothetical protein
MPKNDRPKTTDDSLKILGKVTITLEEAAGILCVSMTTIYRALDRGLEHLHTGPRSAKVITSREAVRRYMARLNGLDPSDAAAEDAAATTSPLDPSDTAAPAPPAPAIKPRRRKLAAIDRDLDRAGIGVRRPGEAAT